MATCIVIGGGIIGMLTARALHLAGVNVRLLERGALGGESSWAGGGILSPLYPWRYDDAVNVLAERSKRLYPDLVRALRAESGIDSELINSGLLLVDNQETVAAVAWAQRWQVEVHAVRRAREIAALEPTLSREYETALWMPNLCQVRNPKLVQALRGSLQRLAISCLENTPVDELLVQAGRIEGVRCGQQYFNADRVVVCSGAWTGQLLAAHLPLGVEPVKGQMIMLRGDVGLVKRMVLSQGHYIIPRKDGRILVGSTLEHSGFNKAISENALVQLRSAAAALVPALAALPLERQWAGLRPGTPQGIPYIGSVDAIEGLYVHAGHYRNGIVLAPASTELLVEIMQQQTPFCDAAAYALTASH